MFGSRLTEADRPRVMKLFLETGAIAYGQSLRDKYFAKARQGVEKLETSEKLKTELREFIEYVEHRSS